MKVLMLNGSVNRNGNTQVALEEIAAELKSFGIESEIFPIGVKEIRDCIGCNKCRKKDASLKMISATPLLPRQKRQTDLSSDLLSITPIHPVGSYLYWIGSSILPDLLLPLNRRLRSLLPAEAEPRRHSIS